jgi:hypothetical protein
VVEAALGPDGYELATDSGYRSTYVMYPAEGRSVSAEGWAVETSIFWLVRDGEIRKVPGLSLYRPTFRLRGSSEACEIFVALDFDALLSGSRDRALLETAWEKGVADPDFGGERESHTALLSDVMEVKIEPITYELRYFEVLTSGQ